MQTGHVAKLKMVVTMTSFLAVGFKKLYVLLWTGQRIGGLYN